MIAVCALCCQLLLLIPCCQCDRSVYFVLPVVVVDPCCQCDHSVYFVLSVVVVDPLLSV